MDYVNLQYLQLSSYRCIDMKVGRAIARRFAETMLFWRGHFRAKEVQDFLGVSERTARGLIADWRDAGILPRYRHSAERRLVPDDEFDPGPPVTDPNVAFSLLVVADLLPGNPFSSTALLNGGHDLSISAPIASARTREVLAAGLDRQAVRLIYASKTGSQELVFSPSALVRSRGRYHLRGHRADGRDAFGKRLDDRYVDVVPARVIEAWRTEEARFIGLEDDTDWHTFEERRFVLSNALSEEERRCYEHEYGIVDDDQMKVKKRRALMPYVLQELSERRCWRHDGTSVRIWEAVDFVPTKSRVE